MANDNQNPTTPPTSTFSATLKDFAITSGTVAVGTGLALAARAGIQRVFGGGGDDESAKALFGGGSGKLW